MNSSIKVKYPLNSNLQITENIRKALQSSAKVKTAAKIHLMRIKQKALGPKPIPVKDRVYFAIGTPKNMNAKSVKIIKDIDNIDFIESLTLDPDLKDTIPVFISSQWTLGRSIDSICETCNIKNENNKQGDVKLRIFRQLDGYCISPLKMDIEISELMKQEILLEGDKLIVEYIATDVLSNLEDSAQIFLTS